MIQQLLVSSESSNKLTEERFLRNEGELRNQKASLQTIENQVGQIAKLLSERPTGGLPSNTEKNPNAQIKAITLRSGKTTIPTPMVELKEKDEAKEERKKEEEGEGEKKKMVPYPGRLVKEKMDEQFSKFLELIKQLHVNLPFIDILTKMPKYAKFLKDILCNKKKLEEISMVTLNKQCSVIILNNIPLKLNDPGSFVIPCDIGDLHLHNALADLGASVSLMPYSMLMRLGLGEPEPTRLSLSMADK